VSFSYDAYRVLPVPELKTEPDLQLVPGGSSDHEQTFDEFVLRTRTRLVSYAKALTGDGQAAQDIAQDTFVRAWKHWSKVRYYEEPEAWCRKVAQNLAIGRWRRLAVVTRSASKGPASAAEPDVGHLDVAAAIRSLPSGQRNAVVMHGVLDMSVAEIAMELGVPEGTVKSWLSRGRAHIRSSLGLPEQLDDRKKR
jgi:RNA polymerase sigma-70 factor, ECF subfamily